MITAAAVDPSAAAGRFTSVAPSGQLLGGKNGRKCPPTDVDDVVVVGGGVADDGIGMPHLC